MEFDWDDANIQHIARHGVTPDQAEQVLTDPERIASETYPKDGEARLRVTGLTYDEQLLTVIVTMRPIKRIRVVTARPASPRERQEYQEANP